MTSTTAAKATSRLLPEQVIERIVDRLRNQEPDLEAILLCGSFARGEGNEFSDVDILALTKGEPRRSERTWIEVGPDATHFHVSIGASSLASFVDEETEAARWALGFPVTDVMQVVWTTNAGRLVVGNEPSEQLPSAPPELEDFAELYMKVRRAVACSDGVLLRWASRMLAEFSAGLLRPFNAEVRVSSAAEAISAALAFENCPPSYCPDFKLCWGLEPASDFEVFNAATRLQQNVLRWLRVRLQDQVFEADDIRALLLNGSLQAYLDT